MSDVQSGKGFAGTMLQNKEVGTNMQVIANNLVIASSNLTGSDCGAFSGTRNRRTRPKKVTSDMKTKPTINGTATNPPLVTRHSSPCI